MNATDACMRCRFAAFLCAFLLVQGCLNPLAVRHPGVESPTPPRGKGPDLSDSVVVASPREQLDPSLRSPGNTVETWVVHTRACEQGLGTNPWPSIAVARLDDDGGPLHGTEPDELLCRMARRPVVMLVHGNDYNYHDSTKQAIEVRAKLQELGGLAPDALFVVFDWPSERQTIRIAPDLNEKTRRARVAGYHLAGFLQSAPQGTRICMMGHSDGGRVVLSATHLLSGAALEGFWNDVDVQLATGRRDLRIRCVTLEAAVNHSWLNPGARLGETLPSCEALLNLNNRCDYALLVFALGRYTGIGPALGRVGFTHWDKKKLGPLMDKVEEIDHTDRSGFKHTNFVEALEYPDVGPRIAAYTSWAESTRSSPAIQFDWGGQIVGAEAPPH